MQEQHQRTSDAEETKEASDATRAFLAAFAFNLTRKDDPADLAPLDRALTRFLARSPDPHAPAHVADLALRVRARGERDLAYMILCALSTRDPDLARRTLHTLCLHGSWRDLRGLCRYAARGMSNAGGGARMQLARVALRTAHDQLARELASGFVKDDARGSIAPWLPRSGTSRDAWMFDQLAMMWTRERTPSRARRGFDRPDVLARARADLRAACSRVSAFGFNKVKGAEATYESIVRPDDTLVLLLDASDENTPTQRARAADFVQRTLAESELMNPGQTRVVALDPLPKVLGVFDYNGFAIAGVERPSGGPLAPLVAIHAVALCAARAQLAPADLAHIHILLVSDMQFLRAHSDFGAAVDQAFAFGFGPQAEYKPRITLWNTGASKGKGDGLLPFGCIPQNPNIRLC